MSVSRDITRKIPGRPSSQIHVYLVTHHAQTAIQKETMEGGVDPALQGPSRMVNSAANVEVSGPIAINAILRNARHVKVEQR